MAMSDDLDDLLTPADRAAMAAWNADAYAITVEVPTSKITDDQLDELHDAIGATVDAWAAKLDGRDWDPFFYGHGPMYQKSANDRQERNP